MRVRRRSASREVAVGARIVLGPDGIAVSPVAAVSIEASETKVALSRIRRIHQAREGPLGILAPVGREGKVVVLDARVFAEGTLEGVQSSPEGGDRRGDSKKYLRAHPQ